VSLALQYANESWFAAFVDLGAILGMTAVILVMAYGQTRILFAMSRDGLLSAVVPLGVLGELVNMGTLAAFCLVSVVVIVLRKKRPDLHRAFHCPGVPLVPLLAIAFCAVPMAFLSRTTWAAFLIWLALGLLVYFAYARQRSLLNKARL
jgi:APA family basic amino acid/polyamine antiporter